MTSKDVVSIKFLKFLPFFMAPIFHEILKTLSYFFDILVNFSFFLCFAFVEAGGVRERQRNTEFSSAYSLLKCPQIGQSQELGT